MKRTKRKRCPNCRELFRPDRRLKGRQAYCPQAACQRIRQRANEKDWRLKNPECLAYQQELVRKWFRAHPDYSRTRRNTDPAILILNRDQTRKRMREIRRKRGFDKSKSILAEVTENKADRCFLGVASRWLHIRLTKASRLPVWNGLWDNRARWKRRLSWPAPRKVYDLSAEICGRSP